MPKHDASRFVTINLPPSNGKTVMTPDFIGPSVLLEQRKRDEQPLPFKLIDLSRDNGLTVDLQDDAYPTQVHSLSAGKSSEEWDFPAGATYYGMVTHGAMFVDTLAQRQPIFVTVKAGMFFCIPGPLKLSGKECQGMIIARLGYEGYPSFGGPLEQFGRLKYIDGCSDTLLLCPPVIGEPCLNHLHIPPSTEQTAHTHPSQRIGVILRGSGYCLTPYRDKTPLHVHQELIEKNGNHWIKMPLRRGMGWWIPTGLVHSFHTEENEYLDVVAWHPDSDFGPEHHNHPMVNRTYVGGVAASDLPQIQTQEIAA